MTNKIEFAVKYRKWWKGIPPRPIKLQIPGWAGDSHGHATGDRPQPWHCPPFVEGSTYGLELIYPFDTECHIKNIDGKIVFEGEWEKEQPPDATQFPPFMSFAPGHYGFTSSLDIKCDPEYVLRIEPHPRFYTDQTGTVPVTVAGHIQGSWWPKIFFVVFRSPRPGEVHIFKKDDPYAQLLVLPKRVTYSITEMDANEQIKRGNRDAMIGKHAEMISKNSWKDYKGNAFNDKYKVLSAIFAKEGEEGVDRYLAGTEMKEVQVKADQAASARNKLPRKFIRRK
jgi:hypothetical protein